MRKLMILLVLMLSVIIAQAQVLTGTVKDTQGEGLTGASVQILGTSNGASVDLKGKFTIKNVKKGAKVKVSFIGYKSQTLTWSGAGSLDVVLEEESTTLGEAVVTAMGIVRKQTSLTYSTQQLRSDDLMKVQDPNLVNGMEGKVAGVTITPSAGGAGGASKIVLRGNKSILGNNTPLIVVDGVPMTNNVRGQIGAGNIESAGAAEGGDPLSMINPDDIESMNVLKGANAAALYGSQAANGVVMITTKKGKEGRLDVNFTSNVTIENPLLTPQIQNQFGGNNGMQTSRLITSWGRPVAEGINGVQYITADKNFQTTSKDMYGYSFDANTYREGSEHAVYLRNQAMDDIAAFYRTGVTTNNSISLSGGTEKMKNYFSYANSYANGMVPMNNYVRNTFALRQNFFLWKRLTIDVNANYVTTRTKNRVGGGTCGNPIYDLYLTPRDVDMDYYRNNYATTGAWRSSTSGSTYYVQQGTTFRQKTGFAYLGIDENGRPTGTMQNWAIQNGMRNNPYWLVNMNTGVQREDRFYGNLQAKVDIWDGLAAQARVSIDHTKFNNEGQTYATTWGPNTINPYGSYHVSNQRTNEIYTDYLLSYNKTFAEDWSVSATAGYVAHVVKGETVSTYMQNATYNMTGVSKTINGETYLSPIETYYNLFDPQPGSAHITSKSKTSNWDQAALATVQLGWKDMVYVDGSYRHDWYRAFRQKVFDVPDNYGYFGFGATAVVSELFKLPEPVSYLKYRLSYSEVGNSIPNISYALLNYNYIQGTYTANKYNNFAPVPEKTKSFETGIESQFFHNALNFDVTYYNSAMTNSYLVIPQGSRLQPVNTGVIRNQGVELTIGYDWQMGGGWRWKTGVNFSYNHNKVEKTYTDETGASKPITQALANGVEVRYIEGGQYGDMYTTQGFDRYTTDVYQHTNGSYSTTGGEGYSLVGKAGDIVVNANKPSVNNQLLSVVDGKLNTEKVDATFIGNMNSKFQLSWSNTFSWKGFNLYFLINGRIGGKVVSLTEKYLDKNGVSQRTADARNAAIAADLGIKNGQRVSLSEKGAAYAMYINEGRNLVSVEDYFDRLSECPENYVYNATNFRLRELSFGYTFRDLFGNGKSLSLSAVARNLFFIYREAPIDPDVSISTSNSMSGVELFNVPSARSFGFNLKMNF